MIKRALQYGDALQMELESEMLVFEEQGREPTSNSTHIIYDAELHWWEALTTAPYRLP